MDLELVDKNKALKIRENTEYETTKNINLDNYTIYFYSFTENIEETQIKTNNFYLIKEYHNLHRITYNYIRIPKYLEEIQNNYYLNFNCQIKQIKSNYYKSLPNQIIENNKSLSSFLSKNYYSHFFPLIFINSLYYKDFLEFIDNSPKFESFKVLKEINLKLILSSDKKYKYNHSIDLNNIILIGQVVENVDLYDKEEINQIIADIKRIINKDYKQYINELIMIIMDHLVEFFLFLLNKKPYYTICKECNNPILYFNKNEENDYINLNINNENIYISKSSLNNALGQSTKIIDFDHSFCKSMMICSNLNNILLNNNYENNYLKKAKEQQKNLVIQKNKIVANPPKKIKSINIIYHDENYKLFNDSINKDAKRFEEASKGSFIYSNSMKVLQTIMKEIYIKNGENIKTKFLLITTGSTFKKVVDFLINNNYINLITKACIYCMKRDKYKHLLEEYKNILGGIFHVPSLVEKFIEQNLSEDNILFEFSKLVTYEKYLSNYHILHETISKYYSNSFHNSNNITIDLLNEIFDYNSRDNKILIKALETLKNDDYEIITEYTKNFYRLINQWLLKSDQLVYEKTGYLIGGLMYKLNEYGINKKKGIEKRTILYRGVYLNYLDALSYKNNKNKIISFQTFLSTSPKQATAEFFSRTKRTPTEERQKECKFSSLITIEYNWNDGLFPLCFDITDIAKYKTEKECLFHPYTFFKIKNFKIDLINYTLDLELETIGKKEILEEKLKLGKKIKLNESQDLLEIENK